MVSGILILALSICVRKPHKIHNDRNSSSYYTIMKKGDGRNATLGRINNTNNNLNKIENDGLYFKIVFLDILSLACICILLLLTD